MTDQEKLKKWHIIENNPKLKLVIAKEAINSRMGLVLWQNSEYDHNSNYSQEKIKTRLLEILNN